MTSRTTLGPGTLTIMGGLGLVGTGSSVLGRCHLHQGPNVEPSAPRAANASPACTPWLLLPTCPPAHVPTHQIDSITGLYRCQVAQSGFGGGDRWSFHQEDLGLDGEWGWFQSRPLPTNKHTHQPSLGLCLQLGGGSNRGRGVGPFLNGENMKAWCLQTSMVSYLFTFSFRLLHFLLSVL